MTTLSGMGADFGRVWGAPGERGAVGVGPGVGLALGLPEGVGVTGAELVGDGSTMPGDGFAVDSPERLTAKPTPTAAPTSTTTPAMIKINRRREPPCPEPGPPGPPGPGG